MQDFLEQSFREVSEFAADVFLSFLIAFSNNVFDYFNMRFIPLREKIFVFFV